MTIVGITSRAKLNVHLISLTQATGLKIRLVAASWNTVPTRMNQTSSRNEVAMAAL